MNGHEDSIAVFRELAILEQEGNFNAFILQLVKHYNSLFAFRHHLLERTCHLLKNFRHLISPLTIRAFSNISGADMKTFGLAPLITLPCRKSTAAKGQVPVAVMTSQGLIRDLVVQKSDLSNVLPHQVSLLDEVGAPVLRFLGERLGYKLLPWNPGDFRYSLNDSYGNEDNDVRGNSIGLALALALYSRITETGVSPIYSAIGEVKRNGTVRPVDAESVDEKLDTLKRERHELTHVFVPADQEVSRSHPGLKLIRVKDLSSALATVFPGQPPLAPLEHPIDVEEELRKIGKQYGLYLLNTCIENTQRLIDFLQSNTCSLPREKVVRGKFYCYWRQGSCYCHKGAVEKAKQCLIEARKIYDANRGIIPVSEYLSCLNSYGVVLKDIFRYKDAEKQHLEIEREIKATRGLDLDRGKNLSSLSQLYLAQGRFQKALEHQRTAISLLPKETLHRNYGYLAQIFTRMGDLARARRALEKAEFLLKTAPPDVQTKDYPFYHWILAECLLASCRSSKRSKKESLNRLSDIPSKYPKIEMYTHALVYKFWGHSQLEFGIVNEGMAALNYSLNYLEAQLNPMYHLLGASVRVERALYLIRAGKADDIFPDLRAIRSALSIQRDIKRFFSSDLMKIFRQLQFSRKKGGDIQKIPSALESLKSKIPY